METSKKRRPKLILTGGHAATTAYALVQEIKNKNKDWDMFWLGSKYSIEGKSYSTLEYNLLPKLNVKFIPIVASRLQTKFTKFTIPSILKFPVALVQSFFYISTIKPDLVISFGGFSSFPVVVSAKIFGIPVILHEQTSVVGRAAQLTSRFADKIALARESSLKFFPKDRSLVIGNPVSPDLLSIKPNEKISSLPNIFVTGGSRGSQSINLAVRKILPNLLEKYNVFHQTGEADIDFFIELKSKLKNGDKYQVFANLSPQEMASLYKKSDIIISRSGANTVSELLLVRKPVILIPLAISYLNEQLENAKILETLGFAQIITQKDLSPEILLQKINYLVNNYSVIVKNSKKIDSPDIHAASKLVDLISTYLK